MEKEVYRGLSRRQIQAALEATQQPAEPAEELVDEKITESEEEVPDNNTSMPEEEGITFRQLFKELQTHRAPWVLDAPVGIVRNPNQPKDVVPARFDMIEDRQGQRRPVLISLERAGIPQEAKKSYED